jgi:hypothetical protein
MAKRRSKLTTPVKTTKRSSPRKPAKKKTTKKKATKKSGKPSPPAPKLKSPEHPGANATADQIAVYKAEDKIFRLGQKWLEILEVKEEKRRGTDERKDKINNLREAMLSVIREDKHDKPIRELDRCRKWLAEMEKLETALAKFIKAKSERIKALEAEFHGILFGEQQSLPGVHDATKSEAANDAPKINGKDLARKLSHDRARVRIKIGRKFCPGEVTGLGPKEDEVWLELDAPANIRGTMTQQVAAKATVLTVLPA